VWTTGAPSTPGPRGRWWWWIAIPIVVLAAGGAAAAILLASSPNNTAQGSAAGLPPHVTLTAFESTLKAQMGEPRSEGGFATSGVNSVACNMPDVWAVGKKFTCFVYNSAGNQLGQIAGTVETTQPGSPFDANLDYVPTVTGTTGSTGNTGTGTTGSTGSTGSTGTTGSTGNTGVGNTGSGNTGTTGNTS
jgi:hypothetical protein